MGWRTCLAAALTNAALRSSWLAVVSLTALPASPLYRGVLALARRLPQSDPMTVLAQG